MGKIVDGGGSNILMGKIVDDDLQFRGKIHDYRLTDQVFSLLGSNIPSICFFYYVKILLIDVIT